MLVIPAQVNAQEAGALVRPDPLEFVVGLGQVETLDILLVNAREVYGMDVRARFDPDALEIVDADPRKDGIQMIPGEFIKPDFLVRNTVDNQMGTLQYVITQVNPALPVNGDGVVLSILIRGKIKGESVLRIDFVEIANREGRTLPVTSQNGTIIVGPPKPVTPTPTAGPTPSILPTASLLLTPAPEIENEQVQIKRTLSGPPARSVEKTDRLDQRTLVWIAGGGFAGALVLLILAGVIYLRRSSKNALKTKKS